MNRTIKQLIYGGLYLVIIVLIGWGAYVAVKPAPTCTDGKLNQRETEIDCGGPCESCEIRRLKPLEALPGIFFDVEGALTALYEFRNPNTTYGASQFFYTVTLYGASGETLEEFSRNSFIYPGEIKYIFETGYRTLPQEVDRIQVVIDPVRIAWEPLTVFPLPRTQVRNVQVVFDSVMREAVLTGTLTNTNSYPASRVTVVGSVRSSLGVPAAASRTIIQDVLPQEERSFRIVIPAVPFSEVSREDVALYVEVIR